MVIGKPAPFVSAFVDAVDAAIRTHQPIMRCLSHSAPGPGFAIAAVLVSNSICWARFARASLGTYALTALSDARPTKIPWDRLLVASIADHPQHHGLRLGQPPRR